MDHDGLSPFQKREIARHLDAGGLIAYPTEAVFGLGCDPLDGPAVMRLLALKQRDPAKGLILIADHPDGLRPYTSLDQGDWERICRDWPAARTVIVPAAAGVPDWLTGGRDEIALRVPAHATARAICAAFGGPIVSTSANRSGRPPARSALLARRAFAADGVRIIPGAVDRRARPSQIIHWPTGRIIRS
ncbi:MAG: L-threonylcarbamoyladenylate synthase [Guyparkeria sp.]|uniref:L-threonylcarbamoyladenylate synthase n=1 Tax=Guyparkeria sp. TaxID=2035736 RepID=UPI00397DDFE8